MSRYTFNHIAAASGISFVFFLFIYVISLNFAFSVLLSIGICFAYFILLFVIELRQDDHLFGKDEDEDKEVIFGLKKD